MFEAEVEAKILASRT